MQQKRKYRRNVPDYNTPRLILMSNFKAKSSSQSNINDSDFEY